MRTAAPLQCAVVRLPLFLDFKHSFIAFPHFLSLDLTISPEAFLLCRKSINKNRHFDYLLSYQCFVKLQYILSNIRIFREWIRVYIIVSSLSKHFKVLIVKQKVWIIESVIGIIVLYVYVAYYMIMFVWVFKESHLMSLQLNILFWFIFFLWNFVFFFFLLYEFVWISAVRWLFSSLIYSMHFIIIHYLMLLDFFFVCVISFSLYLPANFFHLQ